jgi:NAD(P)-dependent dehydrogenase (short-subunit alcohol dehydrogenase family)
VNKHIVIGTAKGSLGEHIIKHGGMDTINNPDLDVRNEAQVIATFDEFAQKRWSSIEGMVYAAGVYHGGKVAEMPLMYWQEQIDVNLTGAFLCVREFMRHWPTGDIVLIGASAAHVPAPDSAAYCVSKAGLSMLTRVAAMEGAGRYNIIQLDPGIIEDTNMSNATPVPMELRLKNVPSGRPMTKSEVCEWVRFLLGAGRYANGSSLRVDGAKYGASQR